MLENFPITFPVGYFCHDVHLNHTEKSRKFSIEMLKFCSNNINFPMYLVLFNSTRFLEKNLKIPSLAGEGGKYLRWQKEYACQFFRIELASNLLSLLKNSLEFLTT